MDEVNDDLGFVDYFIVIIIGKGKGIFCYYLKFIKKLKSIVVEFDVVIVYGLW